MENLSADSAGVVTIAVFGDWPYNKLLFDNAKLLVDSVNADQDVSLVMHVGDIHSGSQSCTSAGILPPIPLRKVLPIIRDCTRLRYRLLPYLYTLRYRASQFGEPILRPLFYEFESDARTFETATT